jgi:hypothetical protein
MFRKIARKAGIGKALLLWRKLYETYGKKILCNSIGKIIYYVSKCLETSDCKKFFRGKNIVIIGPNSELSEDLIEKVKSADILVVINKGHRSKVFESLKNYSEKVVLFHCLDRGEETGGGGFGSLELRRKGISAVYYPFSEERYSRNIDAFHRANFTLLPLRQIQHETYAQLKSTLNGYTPNTGYAAIWTIVKGGSASLYVSGINFLRNPYQPNYHTHIGGHQEIIDLIEKYGNHNPDLDLDSFRELANTNNIQMDRTLEKILSTPTEYLFYQTHQVTHSDEQSKMPA